VETRVKERLTGAVILVALIVLLVPELLSGPHSVQQRPARAADAPPERSFTVDLTDGPRKSSAAVPQPAAPDPGPAPTATSVATPVPTSPGPSATDGVASPPSPSPPPRSAPASVARNVSAAAPPPAPAGGTAHAHAHSQPTGTVAGWAIQVGSFTSRENAERLASELRARNFVASVAGSTTNGRKLYRVRVGPEPDRTSAQALAARLRAAGHSGSIVPSP
jgi:DedD protein